MVAGKRFLPLFAGIVLSLSLVFIVIIVSMRTERPPPEFMDQMDDSPRCSLISGANPGVRRQSLTALLINHPEWGIEMSRVHESYGPVDPVLNVPLPGQEGLSLVEVSFPLAGDPYGHTMDGIRFLCDGDVIKDAWTISHRVNRLALRSKSAFQAPTRVPSAGQPQAIPLRGEGAPPTALWLSRCAGTTGPDSPITRCTLEAYTPEERALIRPIQGYTGAIIQESPIPIDLRVTATGVDMDEGEAVITLDVALTLDRLSPACLKDKAYAQNSEGVLMPQKSCQTLPTTLLGPCRCGPTEIIPTGASSRPLQCRPGDGFEDKLGSLCEVILTDTSPGALELSQALSGL